MDWQTVYNNCDTPRRIDQAGHMVGSRSWAAADVSLSYVARDVSYERLLVIDTFDPVPGEGLDSSAADAMRETLTQRQAAEGAPQTLMARTAKATTTKKTEA